MSGDGERLADKLVREKMVDALVRAFEMFEEFDEDGNGVIDKNEYFRLSCKLFPNQERSREQSDAEVDAIDINGDGVISPEEFYQHCRMCLSADQGTFEQALRRHQDVLMDLSKPNAFAEADAEAKLLVRYGIQGSALIDKILPDQSRDDDGAIRPHGVRGQSEPSSSATKPVLKLEDHSEQVLEAYFHRLFALADHDKSGVLEHDEVKELLSASGFAIDQNSIEEIISNADLNHDGVIDYVEFMPMMLNIIRSRGVPQRLNVTDYTRDQLVAYFEALFHEFDRDANGVLDTHEVETLLKHTGFQFTPAEIARVMKNADTNADGLIDLDEFVPMMISGLATHTQKQLDISNHSPEVLTAYFKRLFVLSDHDNSGTLDHAEVEHLLQACGFNIAQETVTALVAAADTNRDGMIDYEEFSVLCVNVLSGAATLQGTLV